MTEATTDSATGPNTQARAVTFRYTPAEYGQGMRASYDALSGPGMIPLLTIMGTVIAAVLLLGHPARSYVVAWLWFLPIGAVHGAVGGAILRWFVGACCTWWYQRRPPAAQTVELTLGSETITITGFGRTTAARWVDLEWVRERRGLYLIRFPRIGVHFIPRRILDADLDAEFRSHAGAVP